jgi:hypothetical protein
MLKMTLQQVYEQRDRFQRAPSCPEEELPLLEKQALVDEVLRGMPLRQIEVYDMPAPDGPIHMVTKGWAQLQALLDFRDNKFPTWSDEDRRRWQKQKGKS